MKKYIPLILLFLSQKTFSQINTYTREIMDVLCAEEMEGRGYVNDGVNKAAEFLSREFQKIGLEKIGSSYFQAYSFPVNSFPYPVECNLDGKELVCGRDFLFLPSSSSCRGKYKLLNFQLNDTLDSELFEMKRGNGFAPNEIVMIHDEDLKSAYKTDLLQQEVQIFSTNKKLIHSISLEESGKCQLIFPDSILQKGSELSVMGENKYLPRFTAKNIIGYLPARKKKNRKKYIVFSAHYDHLGRMGRAIFPGASDNASGVSMLLNLAKELKTRDNNYNILFILFSGEEAGLLGSEYFTKHPLVPLRNIRFLINLDIMGSAENGIVCVNATEYPDEFQRMEKVNARKNYLPKIGSRGKAKNSDHYYFTEQGVPSFFFYSNGGPGYYHDVFDKPETLTFTNYDNIKKLMIDFIQELD